MSKKRIIEIQNEMLKTCKPWEPEWNAHPLAKERLKLILADIPKGIKRFPRIGVLKFPRIKPGKDGIVRFPR